MRESEVEEYLVEQVEAHGGLTRKLKWIGRNSAFDRLIVLNGTVAFVEVKRPGKKPTPPQERERRRFKEQNVWATWVSSPGEVNRLINEIEAQGNLKLA